jgi:hypothetical protein
MENNFTPKNLIDIENTEKCNFDIDSYLMSLKAEYEYVQEEYEKYKKTEGMIPNSYTDHVFIEKMFSLVEDSLLDEDTIKLFAKSQKLRVDIDKEISDFHAVSSAKSLFEDAKREENIFREIFDRFWGKSSM